MITRFIIVRHGNTYEDGEEVRRIGRRTDLPLTGKGLRQASALGIWFRHQGWAFPTVLTGVLMRTRQTAEGILAEQSTSAICETRPWLTEIDHGPDEGQREQTVVQRLGKSVIDEWDRAAICPDGWEVDAGERVAAWRTLFEMPTEHNVLIVTSSGAARFALIALAASERPVSLKLRTGAYGIIESGKNGHPRLIDWDKRPPSAVQKSPHPR